MRNEKKKKGCRPNMALHLKEIIKTKNVVLGLISLSHPFLERRIGEKGRRS